MFTEDPNIIKFSEKVFVYKNFIEKDEVNKINKAIEEKIKEEHIRQNGIGWYDNKTSPLILELYPVWCKINEFLMPEYLIHPQLSVLITKPGEDMFIHADSPGEEMQEALIMEDRWNTCCILSYGAIVYFGEWEGGEVFYPHIDSSGAHIGERIPLENGNELSIKPEPGDLIIHGAHNDYAHGVKEITSGTRYAFSNFVLPASKNPGTFPPYGSKENEFRWNSGAHNWMKPVGFEFQPSEQLKSDIASGNTQVRYTG